MGAPNGPVPYKSQQFLQCAFEEMGVVVGSSGWNLSRPFERFEINNGLSARIIYNCPPDYTNCVAVNLTLLTGAWIGKKTIFTEVNIDGTNKSVYIDS